MMKIEYYGLKCGMDVQNMKNSITGSTNQRALCQFSRMSCFKKMASSPTSHYGKSCEAVSMDESDNAAVQGPGERCEAKLVTQPGRARLSI
jgi:hypothetical protein